MADTITKIQPSDLISDSMVKINRNFEIISNRDDVTESKLNQWTENIEHKLADIRNENGIISSTILNNVQKLENKIDNLTDLDGITKEVENAINNATIDVEGLINDKADELIFSKLDDYVKTSTLNKRLEGYVKSTTNFNINSSGNVAVKATSLQIKKSEGSGDWVDISDEAKLADFVKTHQNNVSGGSGSTGGTGSSGSSITASSIFKQANATDSGISLNADKISIDSNHTLTVPFGGNINVEGGGAISSDNFNIFSTGAVSIRAEGLRIKGRDSNWVDISNEAALEKFVKDHQDTVSGTGSSIDASSIFAKANEANSGITLNANKILIDANHTLNVNTGHIDVPKDGYIDVQRGGIITFLKGGRLMSDNLNIYDDKDKSVMVRTKSLWIRNSSDNGWINIGTEAALAQFIADHLPTTASS